MVFLLDSGASVFALHIPTYIMITQKLKVCNPNQHDKPETLTNANQAGVPVKHYFSLTFSSCIGYTPFTEKMNQLLNN